MIQGSIELEGHTMKAGDGAAIEHQPRITLKALPQCEFLLFDLT